MSDKPDVLKGAGETLEQSWDRLAETAMRIKWERDDAIEQIAALQTKLSLSEALREAAVAGAYLAAAASVRKRMHCWSSEGHLGATSASIDIHAELKNEAMAIEALTDKEALAALERVRAEATIAAIEQCGIEAGESTSSAKFNSCGTMLGDMWAERIRALSAMPGKEGQ